ncbi:MAG TPA: ATP-binding protein [Chthonomonadaceae bacterium]|nr:ATP-binding protein [Chthonomonadaceae bacterium]
MASTNLPAVRTETPAALSGQGFPLDEPQFSESLPLMMVSALERRYLADLQSGHWDISAREGDDGLPLLREVVKLGRPDSDEAWAQAMPHVLTACNEPGHALVMALHGEGTRHKLYLGGRRILGSGARSTEDFVAAQESAFKAYFTGLEMGPTASMDGDDMPELSEFLATAPAVSVLTGIPSGRGGAPGALQSLDRLVKAVGNQKYALLVVCEPVEPAQIDQTLDACRRLKSAVHAYTRRTITRSEGESSSESHTDKESLDTWQSKLPLALFGLSAFASVVGLFVPMVGHIAQPMTSMGFAANARAMQHDMENARQITDGKNWSEAGGTELLDANAEACEALLQEHIDRLEAGRSNGWWKTAIYVAAESEAAAQSVTGALRSLCSGESTKLDPFRSVPVPPYLLREAVQHGQVLSLLPAEGNQSHPLGETFDVLGTCVTSEELSVLVNLPQQEIPGLPMHDMSTFALSAPEATEDSILLGTLQDSQGRDLSPVTVTQAALNRHVFVSGITGYGKTNTCMQILLECYGKLGLPFLVIEPAKAEYRRLSQTDEFKGKLRVYTFGGNSPLPFRINPLSPVAGIPLGRHIDLLKAVFNASFPMYAGMPYVLEEAILEVYAERGWSLFTSENACLDPRAGVDERSALTPCLEDLHDKVDVVLNRKKYGQEVHANMGAALRSRIRSLMVGNKGMALNTRRSTPLADLFDVPTVIELQNLGDDEEKAFVMALLFVLLYEYAEVRQTEIAPARRGKLQHLTLIEEAHRLLVATHGPVSAETADPRSKAVSMFTDMMAEMRAYGEGFIIADQIPTKLAPETLKNSNLKIIHRLVSPDDREAAGSCMNLTDWQKRHLNNLKPGLAIVHDERIGEAVLTRIQPVKDNRAPTLTEREVRALLGEIDGGDRSYLHRHAGCRSCPAPCTFYHRLEEAQDQSEWNARLQPFLETTLLDDAPAAWAAWSQWRAEWDEESQAMLGQTGEAAIGVTHCAVTNAAHKWIGDMAGMRAKQAAHQTSPLTPGDRLQRETAARALGALFIAWARRTEWEEAAATEFGAAQERLRGAIADRPRRELTGCAQCPARCRYPAYVVPIQETLEKQIKPKLATGMAPADRLKAIDQSVAQVEASMPMLKRRKADPNVRRHWLYCALTHVSLPPDLPATVQDNRESVLAMLRQPAIDAEAAELSDIAGLASN